MSKEMREKIKMAYEKKKEEENKDVINKVSVSGQIASEPEVSKKYKNLYQTMLRIRRISGVDDVIPMLVEKKDIERMDLREGKFIHVEGTYQSYNEKGEDGKRHVRLNIIPEIISNESEGVYENNIVLDGFICRQINLRKTPKGSTVADSLLAVNESENEANYIPIIFWNKIAKMMSRKTEVGSHLKIEGRIQSRTYNIKEGRTTYEVSVVKVGIL